MFLEKPCHDNSLNYIVNSVKISFLILIIYFIRIVFIVIVLPLPPLKVQRVANQSITYCLGATFAFTVVTKFAIYIG